MILFLLRMGVEMVCVGWVGGLDDQMFIENGSGDGGVVVVLSLFFPLAVYFPLVRLCCSDCSDWLVLLPLADYCPCRAITRSECSTSSSVG